MWVLVPIDGKGPELVGSDEKEEFDDPTGYNRVQFIGRPQVTTSRSANTNHALDSVETALEWARGGEYTKFYFHSAISTSTEREVDSALKPDFVAVRREPLDETLKYFRYESYSPGQNPVARQIQLQLHPSIAPTQGSFYKFLRQLWLRYLRRFYASRGAELGGETQ